jgi:hypothetical protein
LFFACTRYPFFALSHTRMSRWSIS